MLVKEYPSAEIFTRVQNNILRWGLKDYQLSIETTSRGGYLSWATVASEMVCTDSYDLIVAELPKAGNPEHSLPKTKSQKNALVDDEDRWSITGKKLERFVDGEKSRSTGQRVRSTPDVWVRRVILGFLLGRGRLPAYFHVKGLDTYFPAFALLDHFSNGQKPNQCFNDRNFTGTYQGKTTTEGEARPKMLRLEKFPHQQFYEVEEHTLYRTESVPKEIETSGWAIIPSCDGLLMFLQDKDDLTVTHRLYLAHSIHYKQGQLKELMLLPYQGNLSNITQLDHSMKKSQTESLFFIKRMPDSFDRVPSSVKRSKRRTMRGEAALKLDCYENYASREERMPGKNVDVEFLYAVCEGDLHKVKQLIDAVKDINLRVSGSGGTALHVVAKYQLKDIFKILKTRSDLNYLVKDNEGRLPSQLAMNSDEDVALGTYLKRKEMQQARREGIDYLSLGMGPMAKPSPDSPS